MGIGVVAVKGPRYSCFARKCTTADLGPGIIEKTFLVDCRLLWGRGNSPSIALTQFLERIADWYMRWPALQSLLFLGSSIRSVLGVKSIFESIPPVAEAKFVYRIDGNKIVVSCTIRPLGDRFTSTVILNELAADTFTHGFSRGKTTNPPSGWIRFEPGNDFYDPEHRLRFCFSCHAREGSFPEKVWWGREYTRDHRWCGFEIEIPSPGNADEPLSCSYEVCFIDGERDQSA